MSWNFRANLNKDALLQVLEGAWTIHCAATGEACPYDLKALTAGQPEA